MQGSGKPPLGFRGGCPSGCPVRVLAGWQCCGNAVSWKGLDGGWCQVSLWEPSFLHLKILSWGDDGERRGGQEAGPQVSDRTGQDGCCVSEWNRGVRVSHSARLLGGSVDLEHR